MTVNLALGAKYILEADLEKQDAYTDKHLLQATMEVYKLLGFPKSLVRLYVDWETKWFFKAK